MRERHLATTKGFSLIELVIVVVIIALLGAMAMPSFSRGAAGSSDAALAQDLAVLRKAIDLYAAEHQGLYPTVDNFKKQMTKYTDASGNASNTMAGPYTFGPYLSAIPGLPVAPGGGQVGAASGSGVGWIYDQTAGTIRANTTSQADARGVLYSGY